jgi:hypothetical protein
MSNKQTKKTAGYGVSKVAATYIMPSMKRNHRAKLLCGFSIAAEIPLIFFAFTPPSIQLLMVFLNGIPLAWTWGLVIRYLEGRRVSEILVMGLYMSVMVAGGGSRTWAVWTVESGIVPEKWMPAFCGMIACLICIVCFQVRKNLFFFLVFFL